MRRESESRERSRRSSKNNSAANSRATSRIHTPPRSAGSFVPSRTRTPPSVGTMPMPFTVRDTRDAPLFQNGACDTELGLQARERLLSLKPSELGEDSYWRDLLPGLAIRRLWLLTFNIIACCCCVTNDINNCITNVTGIAQSPWTSVLLNLCCDVLWLTSGIMIIFDFDPERYPYMGLGKRPPVEPASFDEGPPEDVLQDYLENLRDIETRLSRRFGQEFVIIERRLAELELWSTTEEDNTNGNVVDRMSSVIGERSAFVPDATLDASIPGTPWQLEDHLASLGARLYDIEVALAETGDAEKRAMSHTSSPHAEGREDILVDHFEIGDDPERSPSLDEYPEELYAEEVYQEFGTLEHLQLEQIARLEGEELERMEELKTVMMELDQPRLEGEELRRMEELKTAMMELDQPITPSQPSEQDHSEASSIQRDHDDQWSGRAASKESSTHSFTDDNELSEKEEEQLMDHRGSGNLSMSSIPLAGRVSELEVLVAKIVSQLCGSSALSEKLKENLRTMTRQALRKRLPTQRSMLQGVGKGQLVAHALRKRLPPQRMGRVAPTKFLPGKTVMSKTTRTTTAGALRYRRNVLNASLHGRHYPTLPYSTKNRVVTNIYGSSTRFAGTPHQPTRESQGRL